MEESPEIATNYYWCIENRALHSVDCAGDCAYYCPCKNNLYFIYDVAEQAVMFFLYFGFIGLIVQYFKSSYHFPLRYFIYAGITAMLRLIIVNHESSVDTILFAGAILIMVIALCLVLYSNKLKNL